MPSLRVMTVNAGQAGPLATAVVVPLESGRSVTIGRHGEVVVGVDPVDSGVSRQAVTVSATDDGWNVLATNANGVVVYPWGQPARWAESNRETGIRWPLVGLRLVGTETGLVHWVLLENADFTIALQPAPIGSTATATTTARPPTPLTEAQQGAVQAVFAQHLAWPPVAGPAVQTLQAAASRLGVSHAAVYQRLEAVRARAYQFGSPQQIGVSDPEYLYVLIRAGYVQVPDIPDP